MAPTDAAASGSDATAENQNASNTVESNSTASTDAIVNKYMDLVSKLEVHTHTHTFTVFKYFVLFLAQIRDCSVYNEEYKECKSLKSRFNQYFIYGHYLSCDQWRLDYNNCQRYAWREDKEAARELITSELNRRTKRLTAHYDNDVWKKREHPPDDWEKPLPDFMEERNKSSFLEIKTNELLAEQQRYDEEMKRLAAEPKTQTNDKSANNKTNFCTFM